MYAKLIDEWAESEGFQAFQADHATVLRNLTKWLDRHAIDGGNSDQLLLDCMEHGDADCSETRGQDGPRPIGGI